MKVVLSILLLLNVFCCLAQQEKETTLFLTSIHCGSNNLDCFSNDTILVYNLPENKLIKTVVSNRYMNAEIAIKNIAVSSYKIEYKNIFGKRIDTTVKLNNTEKNRVQLCRNKLSSYPQNTLVKLQDKDSIVVYFHSQGCFHSYANKILIEKEKGLFIAKLYNADWLYPKEKEETYNYEDGSLLKTVVLSNKQIEDFMKFENELNFASKGFCTTEDYYTIKSKYFNLHKIDGNCDWNGFRHLRKLFFGE